jgi:thiol-disulfide isomerase/thioredoxin
VTAEADAPLRPELDSGDATFCSRIGLAIVKPRVALAVANDRRFAGRSGSDLIAMIVVLLLATQLRGLVASLWLVEESFGLAMRGVLHVLTRSLVVDLAFLVVGALCLWALAGSRRNLGRAFDLACVAALPLLLVDITATFVIRALDAPVPFALQWGLTAVSWAWTGSLLALAVRSIRATPSRTATPKALLRVTRQVGWGVLATAAAGLAIQAVWIARHPDEVRPVVAGAPAPSFSLPRIVDREGRFGPRVELAASRGKITVVDFWATWCQPCVRSLPKLEALARTPDVEVIAIDLVSQDDPGEAFALFADRGYRMTLLADDGLVSARYNVGTIPHTVVIDREGKVHEVWRGAGMNLEAVVEQIRK